MDKDPDQRHEAAICFSIDHGEIDFAFAEAANQIGRTVDGCMQVKAGMLPGKAGNNRGQPGVGEVLRHADPDRALTRLLVELLQNAVMEIERLPGVIEKG